MKKFFIGAAIAGGTFVFLVIIVRLTGILQVYRGSTSAMSPAIELNEQFFASNLIKPKHYDIIVFKRKTDMYDGDAEPGSTARFIYRLIAVGGEKLEIKNGLAWVNDKLADDSTKLKFYYTFSSHKTNEVLAALQLNATNLPENDWVINEPNTTALLTHPQFAVANKITPLEKYNEAADATLYKNDSSKNWTTSNYGPILIPMGYYFLLGDNRNGARDSRFIGPVNAKDVIGVVLDKK